MDDLNIYDQIKIQTNIQVNIVRIFSEDIGREVGLSKRVTLITKRSEGMSLRKNDTIKILKMKRDR